jgi:hypothetical protein
MAMPVILAIQEGEIRRISVQSQPGQLVRETLSWKYPLQKRAGGVAQGVGPEFKPQYWKKKRYNKILSILLYFSMYLCCSRFVNLIGSISQCFSSNLGKSEPLFHQMHFFYTHISTLDHFQLVHKMVKNRVSVKKAHVTSVGLWWKLQMDAGRAANDCLGLGLCPSSCGQQTSLLGTSQLLRWAGKSQGQGKT